MALTYDSWNIFIKHNDKWRGDYYLTDQLRFTTDKALAARFYLLKSGNTTIINGDRITINLGNRTLVIDDTNNIKLIDRDHHHREINSFVITNGSENTEPISHNTNIFFISDKSVKTALKYEWGMDLIDTTTVIQDAANYKPHQCPILTNSNYGTANEAQVNLFQFQLEQEDILDSRTMAQLEITPPMRPSSFDKYKGAILLTLLLIVLVLCVLISK